MKNIFKYAIVLTLALMPTFALAAEFRVGENPSVGISELVSNDVYMAGGSVTSTGVVSGDLITAGGNIVVSGDISADAMVAGGNVTLLSNVLDDARVAGGTIVITGKVGGDLLIGGGQVTVSGSGVGGDLIVAGGSVRVDAPISGKARIVGGEVFINAPIVGDVSIEADKVTLGRGALISGNLSYKSGKEMIREDGAVVKGAIDFQQTRKNDLSPKAIIAIISAIVLWKFLTLFVCALVLGLGLRRFSIMVVTESMKRPWYELGRGLVTVVLMPVISIILLVTIVGIPLGVLGLFGFLITLIFTWIISPILMGSVAHKYLYKTEEFHVSWKTILLGSLIYVVLELVPFVGDITQMFVALLIVGVIVSLKLQTIKEWR